MKRALALTFAALLFGVAGLAQISGSWSGKLDLLPTPSLVYTELVLTYTVAGFDLTAEVYADPDPSSVKFKIDGALGPAEVSGVMGFDPTVPAYAYTDLSATLDFAGVGLTGKVFHGVYDYGVDYFESTYALTWSDLCPDQTIGNTLMLYTFKASIDPVSLQVRFLDCCDGIEFFDFTLDLSDISLCCGIAYDFTLYFTKDGFEYVLFTVDPLVELCCGFAVGVEVEFGVNYKSVTPKFSWGGIEGCVTVWGDVQKKTEEVGIDGWTWWGYKVYCELAECNYIEFVHAFDPANVNPYVGYIFETLTVDEVEVQENEYVKLGFCGPACCGGTWSVDVTIIFAADADVDLFFGVTRLLVSATVPLMDSLSLTVDYGYSIEDGTSLGIGWSFSF
jgi:hypothetical protein